MSAAHEAIKITKTKVYNYNNRTVNLPDLDYKSVIVIRPKDCPTLVVNAQNLSKNKVGRIVITNEDSFSAASRLEKALVLNFANAHVPGGAFKFGGNAQEEQLCKSSTLYDSISSSTASKMYLTNNLLSRRLESDYILVSPNVAVFKDDTGNLLEKPFLTSVITAAAPNRRFLALTCSKKTIANAFTRRIRTIVAFAAQNGYQSLILGAWGCGAFENKPEDVAEYFKQVLIIEGYAKNFDEIRFAIHGEEKQQEYPRI